MAAFFMLGGGMLIGLTGVYLTATNWDSDLGPVIATIGFATEIASIPLFIASSKNRKRAMSVTTFFKIENMQAPSRS